ncbi:AAA family ATPase [Candidatus Haliotispira prima]|uniref:AAA family ATPase n=1 Tax=Candidatus Haliotispira prima TaxID=3034016 RepID=A0ABY8MEQ8_9SPIO|nr:AAA family ATPase [Candidatus Haliotispira prima]
MADSINRAEEGRRVDRGRIERQRTDRQRTDRDGPEVKEAGTPAFLRMENACLTKFAKLPALYRLLYRQYRTQLFADLEKDSHPPSRSRDRVEQSEQVDVVGLLALSLLSAQALASGDLRGEEWGRSESENSIVSSLEGQLCFRLDELHTVLLSLAPSSLERERETGPLLSRFPDTVRDLCRQSIETGLLPGFRRIELSEMVVTHPAALPRCAQFPIYFWYWCSSEQLCFSLSRLGSLQLSLWQSLRQRSLAQGTLSQVTLSQDAPMGSERKREMMAEPISGLAIIGQEQNGQEQNGQEQNLLEQPEQITSTLEEMLESGQALPQSRELLWSCLEKLCHRRLLLISGGPGSGKTTLLAGLLQVLQRGEQRAGNDLRKLEIALCAPTARAARRMLESLRQANAASEVGSSEPCPEPEAQTLHKLLNLGWSGAELYRSATLSGKNYRNARGLKLLRPDILVLDEASMLDSEMAWKLLMRMHPETRLIFVGDPDQLPPVGLGAFWKDLFAGLSRPRAGSELAECLVRLQGSYRSVDEIRQLGQCLLGGRHQEFCAIPEAEHHNPKTPGTEGFPAVCRYNLSLQSGSQLSKGSGQEGGGWSWNGLEKQELLRYLWQDWCPEPRSATPASADGFAPLSLQRGETLEQSCGQISDYFQWMQEYSILSPLQRGPIGAGSINRMLLQYGAEVRQEFGREAPREGLGRAGGVSGRYGLQFFHGCPIQITRNNYQLGLFNGDRGFCFRFGTQHYGVFVADGVQASEAKTVVATTTLGAYRLVPLTQLADCEASFVQTIHKSQGSEYDSVCILLPEPEPVLGVGGHASAVEGSFNPWSQALLYTAITRAKQRLCFIGSRAALEFSVQVRETQVEPSSLLTQLIRTY